MSSKLERVTSSRLLQYGSIHRRLYTTLNIHNSFYFLPFFRLAIRAGMAALACVKPATAALEQLAPSLNTRISCSKSGDGPIAVFMRWLSVALGGSLRLQLRF
jgi:hypothetical protein